MRQIVTNERLSDFLRQLASSAREPCRIYLIGGACALRHGWRETTIDVDLLVVPDIDSVFRAIPALKNTMSINVELVAPTAFLPELPGWEARSLYIATYGRTDLFELDFYSQALNKLERGHERDIYDVEKMYDEGLINGPRLLQLLADIEPGLYKYPAVDPPTFRKVVESFVQARSNC